MVKAEKVETPSPMITIEIFFSQNEYFNNDSLKFTCRQQKDNDSKTEEVIGQIINWKEGKDVTKKKIKKKQKNKKTKETRTITKTVPDESFFNVFESKKIPDGYEDKDEDDGDEDSETEKTMQALDEAHDAANDLYDMYEGEALEYYLGFGASMSELLGAMGGQYGDEDDSDDNDDDDKKKKKGGKGNK